jgi:hypothetical protein
MLLFSHSADPVCGSVTCASGECFRGACFCPIGVVGELCDQCADTELTFNVVSQTCEVDDSNTTTTGPGGVCGVSQGSVTGAGHYATLDGSTFAFGGTCEYTLLHTFCAGRAETTVQVQQAAWPDSGSAVSAVAAVAVREDSGSTVTVAAAGDGTAACGVQVGGVALDAASLGTATPFAGGEVLRSGDGRTVSVRLLSGIRVDVEQPAGVAGLLNVFVRVVDAGAACGCSEGLLGFMDGQAGRDLLQMAAAGYRSSSSLPVDAGEFASVPSAGVASFGAFGEGWRTRSEARLFGGELPASCSNTTVPSPPPPLPVCTRLAEAVDCCAELAAVPAAYLACISDFCASGLCIAVDPEPCAAVNCSSLEVCVAGSCIQNPDGEVLRVGVCVNVCFWR